MKTEAIIAIEYLLEKLDGGLECHCTIFRMIPGMSPDTARRRLNDWRLLFEATVFEGMVLYTKGWTCNRKAHTWTFTRPFINFLKQQIKAAEKLERITLKELNKRIKDVPWERSPMENCRCVIYPVIKAAKLEKQNAGVQHEN